MARYFDTPLSSDTQTRTLQIIEGIARFLRLLPQLPASSSGPGMATVTKSIGTTSRDYSTITSWEADLDNGAVYSASDDAVGECYNDATFDEAVTINGGGTIGLSSVSLTAAAGERHDGTAGSGVRMVASANFSSTITITGNNRRLSYIEIDGNGKQIGSYVIGGNVSTGRSVSHMICHGDRRSSNAMACMNDDDSQPARVNYWHNNIIYDSICSNTGSVFAYGIAIKLGAEVYNNTIVGITNNNGTGNCYGLFLDGDFSDKTAKNNVIVGTTGTTSGTVADFNLSSPVNAVMTHNASSDTSASGTGSLTSIVTADQFVSTVGGSEDLHLKSGADCIDAGTDVSGTGISRISEDIDGNTRSGTWDIGADEFEAGAGSFQAAWAMGATLVLGVAGGA